ncbi:MAG: NAD(P)/FAD-dependent oxidoreductase [Fusobacteriaceae bacterium]
MKHYDLIVIGGGPSGIFCSINVATSSKKVLLIEKNNKIGKKLLIAGHGKCNLTNAGDIKNFLNKYGTGNKFIKTALNSFKPKDMLEWFEKNKLHLTLIDESGKYFPHTMKSLDVVTLLEDKLKKSKVEILLNSFVSNISIDKEKNYLIKTEKEIFLTKSLVISTGGASYPITGTTGDGYKYAKELSHTIVKPKPALTPIYVDNYNFTELSGISFKKVSIKLFRNNLLYAESIGDLLFTHHNLSGPGIIDFSRYVIKGDILKINFIGISLEIFEENFFKEINLNGKRTIKNFLSSFEIPERFIKKFLELSSINENKKISEITKFERIIILNLSQYEFKVTRVGDFSIAMATAGGVSLEEVNSKTMESKIHKNLYFVGEILNIDGDTGGYNIQAAFSTGYLAYKNIIK